LVEKINKIDKSLANLTKMKKKKPQISKIRSKKGEISTNTMKTKEIIRDYFESIYSKNLKILQNWTDF
jgi:hypothetical protein